MMGVTTTTVNTMHKEARNLQQAIEVKQEKIAKKATVTLSSNGQSSQGTAVALCDQDLYCLSAHVTSGKWY